MVGSVTPMMAQFSNTGGSKSLIFSEQEVAPYYNRLSVGYNATFMSAGGLSTTCNGFTAKYVHGFGLSKTIPLYLEAGLKLNMDFWSNTETNSGWGVTETDKFNMLYVGIPVNVAYRLSFNNNISLQPYTGINFRVNIYGQHTTEFSYKGEKESKSESESLVFGDDGWKRFQMGWQIGLGLNLKKFYLGFEYGLDFMKIAPETKTSHVEVSLGVNI